MRIESICRELLRRGFRVMSAKQDGDAVTVSFDFMGGRTPLWLKAVQVPADRATPDAISAEVRAWQGRVLTDIAQARPSPIVRRMIAEHGHAAVVAAMSAPHVHV